MSVLSEMRIGLDVRCVGDPSRFGSGFVIDPDISPPSQYRHAPVRGAFAACGWGRIGLVLTELSQPGPGPADHVGVEVFLGGSRGLFPLKINLLAVRGPPDRSWFVSDKGCSLHYVVDGQL